MSDIEIGTWVRANGMTGTVSNVHENFRATGEDRSWLKIQELYTPTPEQIAGKWLSISLAGRGSILVPIDRAVPTEAPAYRPKEEM